MKKLTPSDLVVIFSADASTLEESTVVMSIMKWNINNMNIGRAILVWCNTEVKWAPGQGGGVFGFSKIIFHELECKAVHRMIVAWHINPYMYRCSSFPVICSTIEFNRMKSKYSPNSLSHHPLSCQAFFHTLCKNGFPYIIPSYPLYFTTWVSQMLVR